MEKFQQNLQSIIVDGSIFNDYRTYVASLTLRNSNSELLFNALYTLSKVINISDDTKSGQLKNAYIIQGPEDFYMGFELINNYSKNLNIYSCSSTNAWIKENTPEYLSDSFKEKISTLSSLTKNAVSISNFEIQLESTLIDVIGLDEREEQISLIWIPRINSVIIGENLLKRHKRVLVNQDQF